MANRYYEITIPVDSDGDIHRRIQELADKSGASFEQELAWAVVHGINRHIRENLSSTERLYAVKK